MTAAIVRPDLDPRRLARIAGALYVVIIVCGLFSELVVRGTLVVPGDAAATAANILAADALFRLGVVSDLVMFLADVAIAVALFVLFAPVSRGLSATAAAFRLTQTAIIGLNLLHQFAALVVLRDGGALTAFTPDQLDALALLLLELHRYGYLLGLVFFAGNLAVTGYLVYRSGFLPRALGVLSVLAAAGYLTDTLLFVLLRGYDGAVSDVVLAPAFVAEIGMAAWLLIRGVDTAGWRRAATGTTPEAAHPADARVGAAA